MGFKDLLKKNTCDEEFMSRYNTTVYKGVAMLMIMVCHLAGQFGGGAVKIFTPFGGIGVAIFLVLSAYGLNESWNRGEVSGKKPWSGWWRKRFLTVWLPYIIVQLVLYWPRRKFNFLAFILDLSCLRPLYDKGWYLSYIFLWYAVFYLVRRVSFLDKFRRPIFLAVSVVFFFIHPEIRAEQAFSFFCGIMISEYKPRRLLNLRNALIVTGFGVIFLALKQLPAVRAFPAIPMNFIQLCIKLPIGIGIMMLVRLAFRHVNAKPLYAVGVISYELYIIHGYILTAVPKSFPGALIFVAGSFAAAAAFRFVLKVTKKWQKKLLRI